MKSLIVFYLLTTVCFTALAQTAEPAPPAVTESPGDSKAESESKSVEYLLALHHRTEYQSFGHEVGGNTIDLWEDALYNRILLFAGAAFTHKDWTFTPWTQNRLEFRYNFREDDEDTEDTVNLHSRNLFYLGFKSQWSKGEKLSIGFGAEMRFANELKSGVTESFVNYRFSPVLTLSGEYENGLSFYLDQLFGFYFDATRLANPDESLIWMIWESYDRLDYRFFRHFTDKVSGGLFFEEYFEYGISAARLSDGSDPSSAPVRDFFFDSDSWFGLALGIERIDLSIGVALWFSNLLYETDSSFDPDLHAGARIGFAFEKNIASFSLRYTAGQKTTGGEWENEVKTQLVLTF